MVAIMSHLPDATLHMSTAVHLIVLGYDDKCIIYIFHFLQKRKDTYPQKIEYLDI